MNSFAQQVILRFSSEENIRRLKTILDARFPRNNLDMKASVGNFAVRIKEELYMSDPISSVDYQVKCFNLEFLEDRSKYLGEIHKEIPVYHLTDGVVASRYKQELRPWWGNASVGQCLRDDTQAPCRNAFNDTTPANTILNGMRNQPCEQASITICDLKHENTSYHVEAFNTPWMQAMNRGVAWDDAGFGNPTACSDEKLLSRRVFRDGNKIPQYEQRLQRRALDRDLTETFHNDGERGFIQHGYDMKPLNYRVDFARERNRVPRVPPRVNLCANEGIYP